MSDAPCAPVPPPPYNPACGWPPGTGFVRIGAARVNRQQTDQIAFLDPRAFGEGQGADMALHTGSQFHFTIGFGAAAQNRLTLMGL